MAENPVLLRQALSKLSQDERLICIWKIAGFSTRDIAQQTGRSEAAVTSMLANAKRKLRRHLRKPKAYTKGTHHDS
jgi:RNA polymerase sigma factor (sigma-70 family)